MNVKDTVSTANPESDYHLRKAGKHGAPALSDNIPKDKTEGVKINEDVVEISEESKKLAEIAKERAEIKASCRSEIEFFHKFQTLEDRKKDVERLTSMAWFYRENGEITNEIYAEEYRNKKKKDSQTKETAKITIRLRKKSMVNWILTWIPSKAAFARRS